MKSEMIFRRIELIVGSLFFSTILMKSLKVSFMSPFIVLSGSSLCLLYVAWMFFSIITKWKIGKGIALLLFFIHFSTLCGLFSILFFIMFWPGSSSMALSAAGLFIWLVVIPGLIYFIIKGHNRDDFWKLLRFDFFKNLIIIALVLFIASLSKDQRIDIFSSNPERTRENLKKQEMEDRSKIQKMNQQ